MSARRGGPAPGLLLVFPPLSHLVTHPELGPAALAAYCRREGLAVTLADLNNRFLYHYLRGPGVLRTALAQLSPKARERLARLKKQLELKAASARAALSASGDGGPGPEEADRLLRRYLDQLGGVLSQVVDLPLPRLPAGVLPAAAGQTPPRLGGGWPLWARFADLIGEEMVRPARHLPAEMAAAARRRAPLIDRFLELYFDPLLAAQPRVLGLSIHNSRQLVLALRMAVRAKRLAPGIHVTLGGPWCKAARELLLAEPFLFGYADSVVPDAGEIPLVGLVRALERRLPLSSVPGLMFLDGAKTRETPALAPVPLEDLPIPEFDEGSLALYPEQCLPFQTFRGCYWSRCTFCYHVTNDRSLPKPMTRRHLGSFVEFVRRSRRSRGIAKFTIADNAVPPRHVEQLSRALLRARLSVRWQAMARFDPGFTLRLCRLAAAAGCRELSFGLETSCEESLRRLDKGVTRRVIRGCLERCAAAGISTSLFVLNYPSQSLSEYEETLRFVCSHRRLIDHVMPLRFELGRNSIAYHRPGDLGITLDPTAAADHDVFRLPFTAARNIDERVFAETTEAHLLRFLSLTARREHPAGRGG